VAPLVMAKRFPITGHTGSVRLQSVAATDDQELRVHLFEIVRRSEAGMGEPAWQWRRLLLPMLLEEAKKRGIDV
jgi:hypothetical protein